MAQAEIEFDEFKQLVIDVGQKLKEKQYSLFETDQADLVYFQKVLSDGSECFIQFQLKRHFIPPVQRFNVRLLRKVVLGNTELYDLLNTLANVLHSHYAIDIFREDKFDWEFTNEQELRSELEHATGYVISHGIQWLETARSPEQ